MKKTLSLILCLALLLAFLAGCKRDDGGGGSQNSPGPNQPQKAEITLACFYASQKIEGAAALFNATNPDYQILVVEYSQFATSDDIYAGLTRLNTEIISGSAPDILDLSSLPYKQYVARGLLENLYQYIDADPDYSRSDFMESVLRTAEIDGGLYQLFSSFAVNTIVGHPSVVGENMGWDVEEFLAVLDAHPEADVPLGAWLTKMTFLEIATSLSVDDYVDWATGTVRFDTDDFVGLLELANTFPENQDHILVRGSTVGEYQAVSWEEELIPAGRQIMAYLSFGEYMPTYRKYQFLFGGELVFKGFPTADKNGNSLRIDDGFAITTVSAHKDGAWQFLRTFLDEGWQTSNVMGFPTNVAAFDAKMEELINDDTISQTLIDEEYVDMRAITYEDVDVFIELIDTASGTAGWSMDRQLWSIISENAEEFFSGQISAERAAEIIQGRASVWISERR